MVHQLQREHLTTAVPLTGGCGSVTATGTITVTPNNTVTAASSTPTLCINTALSPAITHTTTGATGIGAPTGLPAGVTAAWAANTITISGTPTASGTFNYSIPLTGGCGKCKCNRFDHRNTEQYDQLDISCRYNAPTVCINTAITEHYHLYNNRSNGSNSSTGLPAGVTGNWAAKRCNDKRYTNCIRNI